MDSFRPKFPDGSTLERYFKEVWIAITILFIASLWGIVQYNKGVQVHTEVMEEQSKLGFRIDLMQKQINAKL